MTTLRQLWYKKTVRIRKYHRCFTPALRHCPQKKGTVTSVVIISPKKPNSAKRHVANVRLSNNKKIRAAIPGEYELKMRTLKKYSKVLVRGGRIRDIIGVRYKIILGKFDASPLYQRRTARSKYGVKKNIFF